jgi:hypothetical protein
MVVLLLREHTYGPIVAWARLTPVGRRTKRVDDKSVALVSAAVPISENLRGLACTRGISDELN